MRCKATELTDKEAISVKDGERLGLISDLELDCDTGMLVSVIIYGKSRLFGLLGREEDMVIPFSDIQVIGKDAVLVSGDHHSRAHKKSGGSWMIPKRRNGL